MNQKLENSQPGVVIENPPAQDFKYSYGDGSKEEEGISHQDEEDLETLIEKSNIVDEEPSTQLYKLRPDLTVTSFTGCQSD